MTAADYAIIRQRLDDPQVVGWDPCSSWIPPDDSGWVRHCEYDELRRAMRSLPIRSSIRVSVDHLGAALEQSFEPRHRPYSILALVADWLAGRSQITNDAIRELCRGTDLNSVGRSAINLANSVYAVATTEAALAPHTAVHARVVNTLALAVGMIAYGPNGASDQDLGAAYRSWWARCRALLPIADVTNAEIEWGGIKLPPRPLTNDLPGDGGAT